MSDNEIKQLDEDKETEFDYTATQSQILMLCRLVLTLDLKQFLSRIGTCEAITPLVNPTLYMEGCEKLTQIKALAAGALRFQEKVIEVKERAGI